VRLALVKEVEVEAGRGKIRRKGEKGREDFERI